MEIENLLKNKNSLLLGGVLSNDLDGKIANKEFRRYVSELESSAVIKGMNEINVKSILYEIGEHHYANKNVKGSQIRYTQATLMAEFEVFYEKQGKELLNSIEKENLKFKVLADELFEVDKEIKLLESSKVGDREKRREVEKLKKSKTLVKMNSDIFKEFKYETLRKFNESISIEEIENLDDNELNSLLMVEEDGINILRFSQSVKTNNVLDSELSGWHRKFLPFAGNFEFMDLSGMAFRLGIALGKYNNSGTLDYNYLANGKALNIRSIDTATDSVTASNDGVVIPNIISKIFNQACYCALVGAANGSGSMVYTDSLLTDGNNAHKITIFKDEALVQGIFSAIRVLMLMYEKFDCGSVIGFAFLKGLHNTNTVVAHTDEGGWFRDILRLGDFKPSFGGIFVEDSRNYIGMPFPSVYHKQSICAVVDSMLLVSAAGVSLCDPLVSIKGRTYPTVFQCNKEKLFSDGDDYFKSNVNKILMYGNEFFDNYNVFIGEMFGLSCNSGQVPAFLKSSVRLYSNQIANRHLSHKIIAPYYWIEPTSLISRNCGLSGELGGSGPIVYRDSIKVAKFFDFCEKDIDLGNRSIYNIKMKSARTCPLLLHLEGNKLDGLANITPWQFVGENFSLPGGKDDVFKKRDELRSISDYLWKRGQSSIFAPGELNYIGEGYSINILKNSYTNDSFEVETSHFPREDELLHGNVTFTTTRPHRIKNGGISKFNKIINKDRAEASSALERALLINYQYGITGGEIFAPRNSEPIFSGRKENIDDVNLLGSNLKDQGFTVETKVKTSATNPLIYHDGSLQVKSIHTKSNKSGGFIIKDEVDKKDNIINSEGSIFPNEEASSSVLPPGQ